MQQPKEDKSILFQLGDQVKITNPDDNDHDRFPLGIIGVITEVYGDCYKVEARGDHWFYSDHELELVLEGPK